jgi:tetratricopeptide (TPR) repeat protein
LGEAGTEASPSGETGGLDDLDLSALGEAGTEASPAGESGGLDDLDLSGLGEAGVEASPAGESGGLDGLDLSGLGEAGTEAPPSGETGGLDDLDLSRLGGEEGISVPEASEEEKASLGSEAEGTDGSLENFEMFEMLGEDGEDEEKLPDLDSLGLSGLNGSTGGARREGAGRGVPESEKDVQLSEDDVQHLLATLESYPLNLRIICEQIISENEAPPHQVSKLVQLLINGGSPREAVELAGKITKKYIALPKGALKKTAEQLEAEQKSFSYIFFNKFLPVFTIVFIIVVLSACVTYLVYQFIYKPVYAEILYKRGYEHIGKGEYELANHRFNDAFKLHRVKEWFYRYAEFFRDEKQYIYAERKYEDLLYYFTRDKKGALDYARMESEHLRNYEKADSIIRSNILDYTRDDLDGLLAIGDVNLDWGDSDPEKYFDRYEEARLAYARYITVNGQSPPVMERMLKYFIRADKLDEVIPIQKSFMSAAKVPIAASTLAELGGYLLDKRLEKTDGVPESGIEHIEGIKDVLIRAVQTDDNYRRSEYNKTGRAPPPLPEPHYQLGRYYHFYNAPPEERHTLETAAAAFDTAVTETPKRAKYRIDTQRMLADLMIKSLEWFDAEETLVKGVNIYENALDRGLITRRYADAGKLYAALGDIEYFINNTDLRNAVRCYNLAENSGWTPPELKYRLGAAYYALEDYPAALERFFDVSMEMPYNRRLLNALGNVSYQRNDYFAAQGYFNRLINLLERDRLRFPVMTPDERPDHAELLTRMMTAQNNMGVTLNALAARTGSPGFRTQALAMFAESARYWDLLSRNEAMVRAGLSDPAIPGKSLPYLNIRSTLYPVPGSESLLYVTIDKDVLEPSEWEDLAARTGQAIMPPAEWPGAQTGAQGTGQRAGAR